MLLNEAGGFPRRETYDLLVAMPEDRGEHAEAASLRKRAGLMQNFRWPDGDTASAADQAVEAQVAA